MTNKVPARIGAFEIRSLLGQGGMGTVYLAYEPTLDRLVAVKVLSVHDEAVQRRFLKEARFAARLQHPHIVGIYAVGEHEGRPYIAMEYIAGETLAAILKKNEPTSLGRRVQWLSELASGLGFAHRNGVVHRDVKPANLIISREAGLLRLLDFGIARDHEAGATSGVIVGTPQYMSPEQIAGGPVDARSDIFAFGLVAYELLTGYRAFDGAHALEVATNIVETEPVPITSRVAGVPDELVSLVNHCLAKTPEQRPQDLAQVRARLRRITRMLEASSDDVTVVRPLHPAPPVGAPAAPPTPGGPSPTPNQGSALLSAGLADVQALIVDGRWSDALQRLEELRPTLVTPDHWSRFELLQQQARVLEQAERCAGDVRAALARGDDRLAQERIDGESGEVRSHATVVALLHEVATARGAREQVESEARARAEREQRAAEARIRAEREQRDDEARVRAARQRREADVRAAPTVTADVAAPDYTMARAPDRERRPSRVRLVLGVAAITLASALTGALYYSRTTATDTDTAQTEPTPPPETTQRPDLPTVDRREGLPAERPPSALPVPPVNMTNAALVAQVRAATSRGDLRRAASLLRGMAVHDPARPALEREVLQRAQRLASDARQAALMRNADKTNAFVAAAMLMGRADGQHAGDPIGAIALYGAAQQSFAAASAPTQVAQTGLPRPAGSKQGPPPPTSDSPQSRTSNGGAGDRPAVKAPDSRRPTLEVGTQSTDPHPAILAQLDAFERAYETRKVAAVRRVWPTMPEQWANTLQATFRNLSSVDWRYGDRSIALNGPLSTATSRVRIERRGGRSGQAPVTEATYRFELRQRDGRWVISAVTITR